MLGTAPCCSHDNSPGLMTIDSDPAILPPPALPLQGLCETPGDLRRKLLVKVPAEPDHAQPGGSCPVLRESVCGSDYTGAALT